MSYTEFRFDNADVQEKLRRYKKNVRNNFGVEDFEKFGAGIMADFLKNDARRYRDFGPYWPALKNVLIKHGLALGTNEYEPEIAQAYAGASGEETLVMAELFSDYYRSHYIIYANKFLLDADDDEEWTLYDPDYEKPRG